MQKSRLLLCIYTCCILAFSSCETKMFKQTVDEGAIVYTISYPDIRKDNYLLGMMPSQMTTSFANGSFRTDIEASMGLFKTPIISNKKNNKLIHSMKLLNKKYASNLDSDDISKISPQFSKMELEYTDNTKEIAGYVCKEIVVTVPQADSSWSFKLYYTDDIEIENPNRLTPFESIKGVLMEYEAINYNTRMQFTANKVTQMQVDEKKLELESDYKLIDPDTLKLEMESIFKMIQ